MLKSGAYKSAKGRGFVRASAPAPGLTRVSLLRPAARTPGDDTADPARAYPFRKLRLGGTYGKISNASLQDFKVPSFPSFSLSLPPSLSSPPPLYSPGSIASPYSTSLRAQISGACGPGPCSSTISGACGPGPCSSTARQSGEFAYPPAATSAAFSEGALRDTPP